MCDSRGKLADDLRPFDESAILGKFDPSLFREVSLDAACDAVGHRLDGGQFLRLPVALVVLILEDDHHVQSTKYQYRDDQDRIGPGDLVNRALFA
jgi:hypothetical protein